MTHGVFLARLQADPELAGVAAVLFDEVHERSLDSDLALALTLDAAGDCVPTCGWWRCRRPSTARVLPPCSTIRRVVESEGKSFPLTIQYDGRDPTARIEPQMAAAIRRALADHAGSLLAFLPGVAEIERTATALGDLPASVILHRLHGQVDPAAQRAALAPPAPGTRKLVLASAIAETSVTLDDVRIVVDSGLARRPRYDRGAGSDAAGDRTRQPRRGDPARRPRRASGPGVAIRLWEEAATAALPAHDPPEILEADLSEPAADLPAVGRALIRRGCRSSTRRPPPPWPRRGERLTRIGAIDADGRLTAARPSDRRLPLDPRLAHMLIEARALGFGAAAAEAAVLLTERGLGGNDADLELRNRRWRGERGVRAEAARRMAARWAEQTARPELVEGRRTTAAPRLRLRSDE